MQKFHDQYQDDYRTRKEGYLMSREEMTSYVRDLERGVLQTESELAHYRDLKRELKSLETQSEHAKRELVKGLYPVSYNTT
jgi:hypothetical protein